MEPAHKNRPKNAILAFGAVAILAGCANDRGPHPGLPPLGVRSEFLSKNLCSEGIFPEIRLGGVPANAAQYRLRLTNVSVLAAPTWTATVNAEGLLIPEGAVPAFDAPCPGEQQSFTYRLEVMALAAGGVPLAYGWGFVSARSLTRQIELEQAELKQRPADRPNRTRHPSPRTPPFFIQ